MQKRKSSDLKKRKKKKRGVRKYVARVRTEGMKREGEREGGGGGNGRDELRNEKEREAIEKAHKLQINVIPKASTTHKFSKYKIHCDTPYSFESYVTHIHRISHLRKRKKKGNSLRHYF